ncbi:hypothetical protein DPMN_142526 [Dreissena polymorpha]|uniref:Uncharacterized protein n=1 Tax=Dreissena polymorpha TaxID=45954 RepID=A0A9D4GEQ5_DREPO|nr:hypothetical protein DPMN_081262 [Dreissena polymorpha]KAH3814048.1 hypothetical protein DPMN_142526 [Dreissena polymorpha]
MQYCYNTSEIWQYTGNVSVTETEYAIAGIARIPTHIHGFATGFRTATCLWQTTTAGMCPKKDTLDVIRPIRLVDFRSITSSSALALTVGTH